MRELRELLTILFLGLFMGICLGWYIASKEIPKHYERDIERLRSWNDKLKAMSVPVAEVRVGKRGDKIKIKE